ncbi:MAG: RluA family pseudouridine synthase [Bryobacter sp.]|nr:RluA family pseudouridine synthase [Bryobacter sp.]
MQLIVDAASKGMSLKRFLVARFPGLSQYYLRSRVHRGLCTINHEPADWGRKLRGGERIEIEVDLEAENARRPEDLPLEVVFENADLLAVNKAPGMLVHPTKHTKSGTLANAIAHYLKGGRFWFVHRLDRDTSGLLVVAKTAAATHRLAKLWAAREVKKQYQARLAGQIKAHSFFIQAPIGRAEGRSPQWAIDPAGKPAQTSGEVLASNAQNTLVALEPITGRTNQLRLHCAYLGHPIDGDVLYGGTSAERLYLHAAKLEVEGLNFAAPCPFSL